MNFVLGPISMNVVFRVGLEATALQCSLMPFKAKPINSGQTCLLVNWRALIISIKKGQTETGTAALVAISGPKKSRFQGPPLIMALVMDIARFKIITYRAIKATGTFIVSLLYWARPTYFLVGHYLYSGGLRCFITYCIVTGCSSTSRGSEWQSITPFEWLFA